MLPTSFVKTSLSFLLDNGGVIMSTVSGLFAAFRERFHGTAAKVLPIVGVVAGLIWSVASANNASQEQRAQLEDTINRVDTYIQTNGQGVIKEVDLNTRQALNELITQTQGVKASVVRGASLPQVEQFIQAGELATASTRSISSDQRNQLTIWVFPHVQEEVDYAVVKSRLEQIAAHVEVRGLQQKVAPTNSVWFGGGADLDQAKAVALTAASAGLQIRQICASHLPVKNLIQVGGSVGAANRLAILTTAQISALSSPVCEPGAQSSL